MWSLQLAGSSSYHGYSSDNNLLRLDGFSNNRLWQLLEEAQSAGIPLLTTANGNPPLRLDATCSIELDISERTSGDLELAPQLVIDSKALPKGVHVQFIGEPPIGLYWSQGPRGNLKQHTIHIARFNDPPSTFLLKALHDKAHLDIPTADKEEFSTKYFPQIARHNPVNTSRVKSLRGSDVPEPPRLYLSVTGAKPQGVSVHLGFAYSHDGKQVVVPGGEGNPSVIRDAGIERRLYDVLAAQVLDDPAWFEELSDPRDGTLTRALRPSVTLHGLDAVRFIQDVVPQLKQLKEVIVHLENDVPAYTELQGAPSISYRVSKREDGSQDWFNLGIEVSVGDVQVPFEPLFTALADNEPSLMLDDGQYLMLTHPELLKLRQLIIEARQLSDKESSELSISRFQASLWDELQQLGIVKAQAEAWESAVRGLLDAKAIPKVAVPKNMKANLRPYQKEGYQWLHFLWSHRLGGILADDMGLGKTLQTIALLLAVKAATPIKERLPILIIAPTSVAANWVHELEHFAPSLKVTYMRRVTEDPKKLAAEIKT